ncbi:MAG: DNA-3-methyladenine glycosylase [Bacteroidetes bacterium]|nr:DNA-3-methyladenine glycosylase [Bacteroidota bacterium]
MNILPLPFFERTRVLDIAEDLLGKIVVTHFNHEVTSGLIVETEAYAGVSDSASHAFGGRRTARNETMYAKGGAVYVYICYGIHQMLNIVTNKKNIPDAVLIRAIEPLEGLDIMLNRSGKTIFDASITRGPGNVARALGIHKGYDGMLLQNGAIKIYKENDKKLRQHLIGKSKRIGVGNSGKDALQPFRFFIKGNAYVSKPNR